MRLSHWLTHALDELHNGLEPTPETQAQLRMLMQRLLAFGNLIQVRRRAVAAAPCDAWPRSLTALLGADIGCLMFLSRRARWRSRTSWSAIWPAGTVRRTGRLCLRCSPTSTRGRWSVRTGAGRNGTALNDGG